MTVAMGLWDFLKESLEKRIEEADLTAEYPFENGSAIPTTVDLKPGAETVPGGTLKRVGSAILLAKGASDIPLVQVSMTKDSYPVVLAASAFEVEFQEDMAYRAASVETIMHDFKLDTAREAIAERLNRFATYGEPVLGSFGLFNNPNVSVTNSSFNPNTATFQEWVTFLVGQILSANRVAGQTTTANITDVILPDNAMIRAEGLTDPNDSNLSVLTAVEARLSRLNGGSGINFIQSPLGNSAILEANGVMPVGTNKDRIVIYAKRPSVLSRQINVKIAELAPPEYIQLRGLTRLFPVFSFASATKVHNPRRIRYVDIAKANEV